MVACRPQCGAKKHIAEKQSNDATNDRARDNSFKGRPIKFTPERIAQIKNLIAQGKSREEIAGLIGVTVGSFPVTCSKLGISLRRPRPNPPNDLPGPGTPCSGTVISSQSQATPVRFAFEQVDQFLQSAQEAGPALHPDEIGKQKATAANLVLTMQYKGLQRACALDLTDDVLGQLIIEAQVRGMSVGHLVSALIRAAINHRGPGAGYERWSPRQRAH